VTGIRTSPPGGIVTAPGTTIRTPLGWACGLTSIVNLFEPELVVVGGGVSTVGEQLLGPVREPVRASAMRSAGEGARIVQAALGERVGVVGAAAIAHDRVASS